MSDKYESIIGLEVHAQLNTNSKIFCGCSTGFGADSNSQTCPVCLGMPGVLPVLNRRVVECALKMAFAVDADVNHRSVFARKNYFYPDLPKGYQISQFELPLSKGGKIDIEVNGRTKEIDIARIHIEEDAGKSIHPEEKNIDYTLVDYNRCGIPLIEVVSKPDIRSPKEAYSYLIKLKRLLVYLEICTGDMEKGALRCDANISVRPVGQKEFGAKIEIKNMNSFKAVEKALLYEVIRQVRVLEDGGEIVQQTMLWDENTGTSQPMRSKEESDDYRYFPEPDLMILTITDDWGMRIKESLPELPDMKAKRFIDQYDLPEYDTTILCEDRFIAEYYEKAAYHYKNYKNISNWIMGEVFRELKVNNIDIRDFKVTPEMLGELLTIIDNGVISVSAGKTVFTDMASTGNSAESIIAARGLEQISDTSKIENEVRAVISENHEKVKEFVDGKDKLWGYFVGEVMKRTGGKANPGVVNRILKQQLNILKSEDN